MRPHFPSAVQWTAAGLPRVTGDVGRLSSDPLYQFHSLSARCLDDYWEENVGAG